MKKGSYLSYKSPGFILGMFIFALSFLNMFTLFTSWSIGRVHFYIWGALILCLLSIVLGIVYMYWNAQWEDSFKKSTDRGEQVNARN
ncbi:MAG: hypothetical protein AB1796_00350 [Bacillota bacterium]